MPKAGTKTAPKHNAPKPGVDVKPKITDIWNLLENLPTDAKYRVNIERERPELWDDIDISGLVAQYNSPFKFSELRDKVGGGHYKITVWKDGDYETAQRIRIPGPPRVEQETINAGRPTQDPPPGPAAAPGRSITPAVIPQDQNHLYEMIVDLRSQLKYGMNGNGNGNGKTQDPLQSLTSLASLIQTLSGALNQNNDPKKQIDMLSGAFKQGMDIGGNSKGSGPSGEVLIAAEVVKGMPEILKTWVTVEKMKMDMWIHSKRNPASEAPAAPVIDAGSPEEKKQDPVRLALAKLKKAAEAGDDPNFWAAYLTRFINVKVIESIVTGGEKNAIEYFDKIEPGYVTVIQKNFDWFGELFKELKELTTPEKKPDEPTTNNDDTGNNPPG